MSVIMRGSLIVKAHNQFTIMRALELIVGTMSRAHNSTNHYEGNYEPTMSPIMRLIVGLIVIFNVLKRRLHPSHS